MLFPASILAGTEETKLIRRRSRNTKRVYADTKNTWKLQPRI